VQLQLNVHWEHKWEDALLTARRGGVKQLVTARPQEATSKLPHERGLAAARITQQHQRLLLRGKEVASSI
jgi:hypothetical protein